MQLPDILNLESNKKGAAGSPVFYNAYEGEMCIKVTDLLHQWLTLFLLYEEAFMYCRIIFFVIFPVGK